MNPSTTETLVTARLFPGIIRLAAASLRHRPIETTPTPRGEERCATIRPDDHRDLPVRAPLSATAASLGRLVVPRLERARATPASAPPARAVGNIRSADVVSSALTPRAPEAARYRSTFPPTV